MACHLTTEAQFPWKLTPNSWVRPSAQNRALNLMIASVDIFLFILNAQADRRIREAGTYDLRT